MGRSRSRGGEREQRHRQFEESRSQFLCGALELAKKWCPAPDTRIEGGKRSDQSDQFQVRLFASPTECVTFTEFRPFLISFKLHRCTWDQDALATCINDFRGADVGNIRTAISKFAVDLARCISSQNNGVQNSAASKIAFFAKPCEEVYIWDQHAMRSAAFRGRPTKFSDYATFHESCTNALHAERQRQDFVVAVQDFRDYLRHIGGPMASRDILCDSSFVERRLLDKLMFCEGKFLKPKKSATSCRSDHSAESVPA